MFEEYQDILTAEEAAEALRRGYRNGRVWRIPKESIKKYILDSAIACNVYPTTTINSQHTTKDRAEKPPARHKYGSYKNVLFTDEEYAKLQAEYPTDYSERIERLSEYIASSGKSYKSHLATIRSWARKDGTKAGTMPSYGGEENWSL